MKEYIKFFKNYVKRYDSKEKGIRVKYEHSLRVYKNGVDFIRENDFDENDNKLIKFIALFHDIGRFEQIKRYGTMDDSVSIDHGKLGCEIILEENLLEKFNEEEKEIILKSILNHNKKVIGDGLSDRQLFHTKVIRDMDKIDIYRVYFKHYPREYDDSEIKDDLYEKIMNNGTINYTEVSTTTDFILLKLCWVYDLNFPFSLRRIKESNYIEMLYDNIPDNEKKENIKEKINSFI